MFPCCQTLSSITFAFFDIKYWINRLVASTGQFQICCNGTIGVEIHRSGLSGLFRPSIDAQCLRFDSSQMQVETKAEFKVGDALVVDLQVLDLRLEELTCKVTSATATESNHYYDIDFTSGNRRRDTQHCLRQLQTLYEQQTR